MSLDDLQADIEDAYGDLDDEHAVALDRETKNELATLAAAFGADPGELLRRGVHALFRQTVDTGDMDFQLRRGYGVTYDEYLMGTTTDTYENMMEGGTPPQDDDRRYQF